MRFVVVVAVLAAAGCVTTREEGEALKRDVTTLKGEIAEVQRQQSDQKTIEQSRLDDMSKRVASLEGTLQNLRQADADTGVEMDKMVAELQALRGDVEQAKHDIGETTASVQSILARPPVTVAAAATAPKVEEDPNKPVVIDGVEMPKDPKPHYEAAKKFYDTKKWQDAIDSFDLFLHRHKTDAPELLDNAAYWKAEAYFNLAGSEKDQKAKEKALKQAILAYQPVIENPKSEKQDGALYKAGLAFEQIGDAADAKVFFQELISKHPKSSLVGEAKKHLRLVSRRHR